MRVRKHPDYIPSTIFFSEIVDIEQVFSVEDKEASEDPNEVIATHLFALLKPGNERVCVVLRSDGLTYKSISDITGLTEGQIKNIIYTIRKRVIEKFPAKQKNGKLIPSF